MLQYFGFKIRKKYFYTFILMIKNELIWLHPFNNRKNIHYTLLSSLLQMSIKLQLLQTIMNIKFNTNSVTAVNHITYNMIYKISFV
jgi:hypothetical protein